MKDKTAILVNFALIVLCIYLFTGCAIRAKRQLEVVPPTGVIYTSVKAPLTTDFVGNPCGPWKKKASQSYTNYFWLPIPLPLVGFPECAWGDAQIKEIAKKGGIKEVSFADYELLTILEIPFLGFAIYECLTINVYGN
jgi:hypothetical protein